MCNATHTLANSGTYAMSFQEGTECEEALAQIECGVASLMALWDSLSNGTGLDDEAIANALFFLGTNMRREVHRAQSALLKNGGGHV